MPAKSIKSKMPIQDIAKQLYSKNLELLEQRRRTELLLYNVSEIVIAVDEHLRITFFNKVTLMILGIDTSEDILGWKVTDILKITRQNEEPVDLKDICVSSEKLKINMDGLILQTPRGGIYINLRTSTINYQSGKRESLLTLIDVTKEKTLDMMKDEFLSVAAHELRTPMTIIKGYLWMLDQEKSGKLNQDQKSLLNTAAVNAERMTNLINDMLNISRIEKGKIEFKIEKLDVSGTIKEIVKEMKIKADQQKITLNIKGCEEPAYGYMDKGKLHEVILNLVGNAFKFTKEGGITVDIAQSKSHIKVSIIDTGVGINPVDLQKLFKKFERLDNSYQTVAESGGTGLGLYIVKLYMEKMGGSVGATSEGLGKGSTFWFTIPKQKQSKTP